MPQAQDTLLGALSTVLRQPQVSIQILSYGAAAVTLVGSIAPRPQQGQTGEGRYPLQRRTTLMELVVSRGLTTDDSDLSTVIVRDAEGKVGVFDVLSTMYGIRQDQDPVLEDGDVVKLTFPRVEV